MLANVIMVILKKYMNTIVFLLILFSNGAFVRNMLPSYICGGVLIIAILIYCFKCNYCKINKQIFKLCIIFIALQFLSIILNGLAYKQDLYLFLVYVCALFFVSNVSVDEFIYSYRMVIVFIAVVSNIFFFLGMTPFLRVLSPFLFPVADFDLYAFLGTFTVRFYSIDKYYRNFGLFSEPGQFQIFLNIGLFLELFSTKKINPKILLVYIITFLTCNSTNGYISALLIILAYLLGKNYKEKSLSRIKRYVALLIGASALVVILIKYSDSIFLSTSISKIKELFTSYNYNQIGSGLERRRAIDTSIKAFLENPFFGLGYAGLEKYISHLSSNGFIMTFSPMNWFARFGFLYGFLANYLYIAFFISFSEKRSCKIILTMAAISIISAQAVNADIFIYVIIFYGLNLKKIMVIR